jgi:CheY-like chemotaxis protein
VLVVDDNRDGAESLALLIGLTGHEVRTAHDGPAALAEARRFLPRVAFLDIGLPGMNGYELARAFRADPQLREVLLVAVTGWGSEEDKQRSREAGFDVHLTKPASVERVLQVLAEAR